MNEIELNIKNTYDKIAFEFNKTRIMIWNCVQLFIGEIEDKKASILDAGCGNGKNMLFLKKLGFENIRGCDFSDSFIKLCQMKDLNVEFGNLLELTYKTESFDNIISIAVIHHLSTEEHRVQAIKELVRVLKKGGKILITVSSFEFPFYKKMETIKQDLMIPWKNPKGDIIGIRYYYLFKENELEKICYTACPDITHIRSFFEHENWCVVLTK